MIDAPQLARPGALHIVATPIGNLRDITLRALDTLRSADLIAAEDTRHTQTLLAAHGIRSSLLAVHEHNESSAAERVVAVLREGRSVAYVSDAGTPGISDPGARLVQVVRGAGFPVVPVPGPSAVATLLSVAGWDGPWLFHGFLPPKPGERRKTLEALRDLPCALVFYEAPHRISEAVADLASVLGEDRELVLARELTKRFEQIHAGALGECIAWLAADENHRRGEFALLVMPPVSSSESELLEANGQRILAVLLAELPLKQAASLASRITGIRKNLLYEMGLKLKADFEARAGDDTPS